MYDLIINAPNIRMGGGMVLLRSIIDAVNTLDINCLLIANEFTRDDIISTDKLVIKFVNHSLAARLKNEYHIKSIAGSTKKILFFGNLPPIFKLKCDVVLYMQNAYIINNESLHGFSIKPKLRIILERLWFKIYWKNVNKFMVQTKSMNRMLSNVIERDDVEVCPFVDFDMKEHEYNSISVYDFIYPSSGEPHKNHRNLVMAWILLADRGLYPTLYITLDNEIFKGLVVWIEKCVTKHNLRIKNLGYFESRSKMLTYIHQSKCLIFPSWLESFGLPLVEAQNFNIPILAPELDYVRDVVEPTQTFNANSPISICSAVLRFLNIKEENNILQPEQFVNKVIL